MDTTKNLASVLKSTASSILKEQSLYKGNSERAKKVVEYSATAKFIANVGIREFDPLETNRFVLVFKELFGDNFPIKEEDYDENLTSFGFLLEDILDVYAERRFHRPRYI